MIKNERKMMNKETAFTKFLAADFAQAEADFKQLLQAEPEDIELRFGLALSLAQQSFFKEAAQILEDLSLDMPESLEIKTALWQAEMQLGKYALVGASIREAYKNDPQNLEIATLYLKEMRQMGFWTESDRVVQDVLKRDQDHLPFFLETCLFYVDCPKHDHEWALLQLASLSQLDPCDPAIAMAFAHALIRLNQAERAIEVLREPQSVGVQAYELQAYRAWAELSAGNIQAAQEIVRFLQRVIPNNLIVLFVSGYLAYYSKQYVKAIRCFSSVINCYESFLPEIRLSAEIALKQLNNAELALSFYRKLGFIEGANYQNLLLIIWLAYSANQQKIAKDYLHEAKTLFPEENVTNEVMSLFLDEHGADFGAQFMQLIPKLSAEENIFCDYALSVYHTVTGNLDAAAHILETALHRVPYDALLTKALVEILIRQKRWDEVFEIGEAFLKIVPNEYELRSQLIAVAMQTLHYDKAQHHEYRIVMESFPQYRAWLEQKWADFDDVKEALANGQKDPLLLLEKDRAQALFSLWQTSASAATLAAQEFESHKDYVPIITERTKNYQIRALIEAFDEQERKGVFFQYVGLFLPMLRCQDRLEEMLVFLEQEEDNAPLWTIQINKIYALLHLQRFDEALSYLDQFVDLKKQQLRESVTDQMLIPVVDLVTSVITMTAGYGDFVEKLIDLAHAQAEKENVAYLRLLEHNYMVLLSRKGKRLKAEQRFGESSYLVGGRTPNRQFMAPLWRGESLEGKTILLWREQGVGDELVHVMLLPKFQRQVQAAGGQILLECSPRLLSIFRRSFPDIQVDSENMDGDLMRVDIDYHMPLGMLYKFTPPDFCLPARFEQPLCLRADYVEKWQKRVSALGSNKKVGIAWQSRLTFANRRHYYYSVEHLRPLLALNGIDFVMLNYAQVEEGVQEVFDATGVRLHTWDDLDLRDDFEQQLALIAQLDLVVSPTMTPGVLARCVGTPNWVLMPHADHRDSPPCEVNDTLYPALVWQKHYTESYLELVQRVADRLRDEWQLS